MVGPGFTVTGFSGSTPEPFEVSVERSPNGALLPFIPILIRDIGSSVQFRRSSLAFILKKWIHLVSRARKSIFEAVGHCTEKWAWMGCWINSNC